MSAVAEKILNFVIKIIIFRVVYSRSRVASSGGACPPRSYTAGHMFAKVTRWSVLQSLVRAVARPRMVHVVDTDRLYREVTAMVSEYLRVHEQRESKVIEFRSPAELRELVDLSLPEEAQSEEVVLQACKDALKYCVHTCEYRLK